MSKINISTKKRGLLVNVDTTDFELTGMEFNNPSIQEAILVDTDTGEVRDRYGNREYMVGKGKVHRMSVRTKSSGKRLCFSGSSYACAYSQNLITSSDVLKACVISIKRAIKVFGISPPDELLKQWLSGDINMTRVDLAVNFKLSSEKEVMELLQLIRRQLAEMYGTTRMNGTSVCWAPKDGKEYSITFYAKGAQLRRSKQYRNHPDRDRLIAEAETILRVEVRLRTPALRKLKRMKAGDWVGDAAEQVFRKYMAHLKFLSVTSGAITRKELDAMPSNLRHVLVVHKSGVDLNRVYKPRTLQRHLKSFRDLGIDLRCPNQHEEAITALPKYLSPRKVINTPPRWMVEAKLVPTKMVASVGGLKAQSCELLNSESKVVASNESSKVNKPMRKTGR